MNMEFYNCYNIVFDRDRNIKPCGREAVINLINASDKIEPDVKHGNTHNGFMNEYLIKKLYDKYQTTVGNVDLSTCAIS